MAPDPVSLLLSIIFYVLFFISIFYGNKIQGYKSLKTLQYSLQKFKNWDQEIRKLTISKFKQFCDENLSKKDIEDRIEDFLNFVTIQPTNLDTSGIILKMDHIMNVRETRYIDEVSRLAKNANEIQINNLEHLLEAAMSVNQTYRLLMHYVLLGKKTKSYPILMQVESQLSLLEGTVKAYISSAKAFAEGSPIGDSIGPMVAGSFIRDILNNESPDYEDIAHLTILQKVNFENRAVLVVRAKGPGGTVGKPGDAIKKLVDKHGKSIKLILMVDAGMKLESDKTGKVVVGVGAAIGGNGVEKSKIEEIATEYKIPIYAIICRESLEDTIGTMKKPIIESIPTIIDKIKTAIRFQTSENDIVILAGIGNSIGIGI